MPNITIQVSDALYQHARLAAARRNMSVSALLRAVLVTIDQQPQENTPENKQFDEHFQPLTTLEIDADKDKILRGYEERQRSEPSEDTAAALAIMRHYQFRRSPPLPSLRICNSVIL